MKFYKDSQNNIFCTKQIKNKQYSAWIKLSNTWMDLDFVIDEYDYDLSWYYTELTKAELDLIRLKML